MLRISEVAGDAGLSRTTLTNLYYRRAQGITFETLNKLCEYLDCEVGDLFEYKPDEKE